MQTTRRSNPLGAILGVLLVLALVALVWLGYQWIQEGDRAQTLENEVAQLRESANNAVAPSPGDADIALDPDATTSNDPDQVIASAQAYERAQPANQGVEQQYEITQREGDFARVTVSTETGSHTQVLKNVDSTWVVVLSGQQFSDAELVRYGVPASLVRE